MSKMASYLQFQKDKGLWRYRRPIPPECRSALGGKKVILRALGTSSESEAKEKVKELIISDDRLFADIIAGDYPALQDEAVEIIAHHWFQATEFPNHMEGEHADGCGFADQDELERSLKVYLIQKQPRLRIDGKAYRDILREAVNQHYEIFHDFSTAHERRAVLTGRLKEELHAQILFGTKPHLPSGAREQSSR